MKFSNSTISRNLLRTILPHPLLPPNRSPTKTQPLAATSPLVWMPHNVMGPICVQKQDANGTWVNIGGATGSSYTINSKSSYPRWHSLLPLLMPAAHHPQFEQCADNRRHAANYPPTIFYQPTLKDFHWIKSNSNNQLESSEPEDIGIDWQGTPYPLAALG